MNSKRHFQEISYERHAEHFREYSLGGKKESRARTWFENDTVDAWRNLRKYQTLDPILRGDSNAKWLTIGDGRYGKDAKYILDKGCDALPTDISDVLLKEARNIGYIHNYRKENAESLTFNDSEFDYVLCKESYHHFPRPQIALYEMLRVAHKGVVLIEGNDSCINNKVTERFVRKVKNTLKLLLGREIKKHSYEESGNYVFTISRREVEKVALGLNYKMVCFKGINDAYKDGVENEKLSKNGLLQKKISRMISLRNLFCKIGLIDYGQLTAIIFKQEPSENVLHNLSKAGYELIKLPDNPYISG